MKSTQCYINCTLLTCDNLKKNMEDRFIPRSCQFSTWFHVIHMAELK